MAVVIRLQGLPLVAGSSDIRHFFSGLDIPDGGVHIIGGEKGEAFIIFATDEDARQAMSYSGGFIKDSRIEFFLSSKTEMQSIIGINKKSFDRGGRETGSRQMGSSGTSGDGSFSNLVEVIKKEFGKSNYDSRSRYRTPSRGGRGDSPQRARREASTPRMKDREGDSAKSQIRCFACQELGHSKRSCPTFTRSRNSDTNFSKSNFYHPRKKFYNTNTLYLFIRGMPYTATEDDVLDFFSGLQVEGVCLLQTNGQNNGDGVVKFATASDAMEALQRDRKFMGSRFIVVRPSNEGAWIRYGGMRDEKMDHSFNFKQSFNKGSYSPSREYSRREPNYIFSRKHTRSRTPPQRVVARTRSRSPPRKITARSYSRSPSRSYSRSPSRTYSRSPRRVLTHLDSRSSPWRDMAHTGSRSPSKGVIASMHSNSPRRVTTRTHSQSPRRVKTHSHSPFSGSSVSNSPLNKEYYIHVKNLSAAVEKRDLQVFFREPELLTKDIEFLKPHGNEARNKEAIVTFKSKRVYMAALTCHKRVLFDQPVYIFPVSKKTVLELLGSSEVKGSPERHHHAKEKNNQDCYSGPKTCVYVRNFPFDVTNIEVQKFFTGFNIDDNDIYLLFDDKGVGLGEALIKFRTEDQAHKAESLNRQRFLGTEVLLRCISEEQMQEFGINVSSEKNQVHLHSCERDEKFYSINSQGSSRQVDVKQSSDFRSLSDDFICSADHFRGPTPFREFGEGVPGNFSNGLFMPDSNFGSGSDCVTLIKLKNIPFRASHNEIMDFFHGYKIIPESLSIQHNEYGMFSGEAIIALVNYKEAVAAVNELNERPIGQRKVRLSLA